MLAGFESSLQLHHCQNNHFSDGVVVIWRAGLYANKQGANSSQQKWLQGQNYPIKLTDGDWPSCNNLLVLARNTTKYHHPIVAKSMISCFPLSCCLLRGLTHDHFLYNIPAKVRLALENIECGSIGTHIRRSTSFSKKSTFQMESIALVLMLSYSLLRNGFIS